MRMPTIAGVSRAVRTGSFTVQLQAPIAGERHAARTGCEGNSFSVPRLRVGLVYGHCFPAGLFVAALRTSRGWTLANAPSAALSLCFVDRPI